MRRWITQFRRNYYPEFRGSWLWLRAEVADTSCDLAAGPLLAQSHPPRSLQRHVRKRHARVPPSLNTCYLAFSPPTTIAADLPGVNCDDCAVEPQTIH